MAKDFDKNRLRRLRIIDEMLCSSVSGVTMAQIIDRIRDRTGISTDRFAVRRDLKFIREELGMDVVDSRERISSQGHGHGKSVKTYRYAVENDSLFKISISDEERKFLSSAIEMIGLKGISSSKMFRSLQLKSDYKAFKISFTKNPIERNIGTVFQNLWDYIKRENVIRIRIRDRKPPHMIEPHIVHPWYLREYNRRWYMFGLDHSSGKIMHFALDRIVSPIKVVDGMEYESSRSSIDEILKDVIGVSLGEGGVMDILFWVSDECADFVAKKPIHHTQVEMQKSDIEALLHQSVNFSDGKFFKINCKNNYELRREMLSFGPELIVLDPNDLRAQLKATLESMCDNYRN